MTVIRLAVLALVLAGCAVPIETQPPPNSDECRLARVGGIVVLDPQVGVGLRDQRGVIHRVIWPFGFSAHRDLTGVVLVDDTGRIVAREGDEIATAGFTRDDGVKHPCGLVEIIR
jgi:hypothetical protein